MTFQFKPSLCLLFYLLVTACGETGPQLTPLGNNATILAFGDSLTKGYGVRNEESYPALLQNLVKRTVVNAGVSGEESAQGLQRLPVLMEQYQPDLLILCHGGNDILRKKNQENMAANLVSMIHMATDKNIPVILLAVPEPGLFLSAAPVYREIADSTNIILIDDLIPGILGKASLKSDSVHPNQAGYKVMAERIYQVLQDSGAI